jgi:hypothetical protein
MRLPQEPGARSKRAKKIWLYDLGSLSGQLEMAQVLNKALTITKAIPLDIGMWSLKDDFLHLLVQRFGPQIKNLEDYQIMDIFETECYNQESVSEEIQAVIQQYEYQFFRPIDEHLGKNWAEVDSLIFAGRSWHKLLPQAKAKYEPLAQQYHFDLFADSLEEMGKLPCLGSYVYIREWTRINFER